MTKNDGTGLEKVLSYKFKDTRMLDRALTHRSWAHEQVSPGQEGEARRLHNEAFEFVGDSVLGLIVADVLFRKFPHSTEGELSRMKHQIVSAPTLTRAAERLSIGNYLHVGRGEEKTGGRKKSALLADAFEAVLGAIYFDGGFDAAREFVHFALADELERSSPESAAAADYKTLLQEILQGARLPAPHKRTFHVQVTWGGEAVRAAGRTIKAAETSAAKMALKKIKSDVDLSSSS